MWDFECQEIMEANVETIKWQKLYQHYNLYCPARIFLCYLPKMTFQRPTLYYIQAISNQHPSKIGILSTHLQGLF